MITNDFPRPHASAVNQPVAFQDRVALGPRQKLRELLTNLYPKNEMVLGLLGMGKCGFQVRYPSKKYRLIMMMMVGSKYKLVPEICAESEFQQLVEPIPVVFPLNSEHCSFEKLYPVIFRRFDQDIRCCEKHVELSQFRQ